MNEELRMKKGCHADLYFTNVKYWERVVSWGEDSEQVRDGKVLFGMTKCSIGFF